MIITLIGSRDCTDDEYNFFLALSAALVMAGHTVYTGDAGGIDKASREGTIAACNHLSLTLKDHLKNFITKDGHRGFKASEVNIDVSSDPTWKSAKRVAARYHPAMTRMTDKQLDEYEGLSDKMIGLVQLMTRNVYQIYGERLSKRSDQVICCAPPKSITQSGRISDVVGGTGQAVRMAFATGTPVLNLRQEGHKELLLEFIVNHGVNDSHLPTLRGILDGL